jgi:hypothetical protein
VTGVSSITVRQRGFRVLHRIGDALVDVIGEAPDRIPIATRCEKLEGADPDVARCDAGQNSAGQTVLTLNGLAPLPLASALARQELGCDARRGRGADRGGRGRPARGNGKPPSWYDEMRFFRHMQEVCPHLLPAGRVDPWQTVHGWLQWDGESPPALAAAPSRPRGSPENEARRMAVNFARPLCSVAPSISPSGCLKPSLSIPSAATIMVVQIDGIHISEHLVLPGLLGNADRGRTGPAALQGSAPRRNDMTAQIPGLTGEQISALEMLADNPVGCPELELPRALLNFAERALP